MASGFTVRAAAAVVALGLLGQVDAVRDSRLEVNLEDEHVEHAAVSEHVQEGQEDAPPPSSGGGPPLKLLHYNLGWESMSGIDFGSGKIASKHCVPGTFEKTGAVGLRWQPLSATPKLAGLAVQSIGFKRSPEQKQAIYDSQVYQKYMTSCTVNMLDAFSDWHTEKKRNYDFVTLDELCSPGANGETVTGFLPQTGKNDVEMYNGRQCSPLTFDYLMTNIFTEHEYVINALPTGVGPVTQMTIYKKSLGKHDVEVLTDVTVGRPLTALLWQERSLLLVHVHNIHFRKTLIAGSPCDRADTAAGTSGDMCGWIRARYPSGAVTATDGDKFTASMLSTAQLQKLYGAFLSARIAEGLQSQGFCTSIDDCVTKLTEFRVIVAGDFNDETGELYKLHILGRPVSVRNEDRVRTCCSDRDEYWLKQYTEGDEFTGYSSDTPFPWNPAQPTASAQASYSHSTDNWKYLLNGPPSPGTSKYLGSCTAENDEGCRSSFTRALPDAIISNRERAAKRNGPVDSPAGVYSRYPFASDLIMDSANMVKYGVVEGYVQDIAQTISDHDPVEATLAPLA
jgi:hypothetical protein